MKKNKQSKSIRFIGVQKTCDFTGFPSILEVALAHDVGLNHSCGGMGSCTTCRIFVTKGSEKLSPPEDVEAEHAHLRGYKANERLACQTLAVDGLEIEIPKVEN